MDFYNLCILLFCNSLQIFSAFGHVFYLEIQGYFMVYYSLREQNENHP